MSKAVALRFAPKQDLLLELQKALGGSRATLLACIGSFTHCTLASTSERQFDGHFEILSAAGTWTGSEWLELNFTIADRDGAVSAGTLLPGSAVYTTVEVLLQLNDSEEEGELKEGTAAFPAKSSLSDLVTTLLHVPPAASLTGAIMAFAARENIHAGFVLGCSSVGRDRETGGSTAALLEQVSIRFANRPSGTVFAGKGLPIRSLQGAFGCQSAYHLHICVSGEMQEVQQQLVGGHLMEGGTVAAAVHESGAKGGTEPAAGGSGIFVEVALLKDLRFTREPCPLSGYDELTVRAAAEAGAGDAGVATSGAAGAGSSNSGCCH